MRWNLLKTYDKIYTIDLHGNSKKKEVCPDGTIDQNVFDIMQGVAITIFVKTGKKKTNQLGKVFHYDLFGKRDDKYNFLWDNSLKTIDYVELPNKAPNYFMVQKDFAVEEDYLKAFSLGDLFKIYSAGVVTSRDKLVVGTDKDILSKRMKEFFNSDIDFIKNNMKVKENQSFKIDNVLRENDYEENNITSFSYRPFDKRVVYYNENLIERFRGNVMEHMLHNDNLGLMSNKKVEVGNFAHAMIYTGVVESHAVSLKEINYVFPLYVYPKNDNPDIKMLIDGRERTPNLDENIVFDIAERLKLQYTFEKEEIKGSFAPIDVLDYVYAVLYSPTYREKYKEFLKIDFPRIPYPKDLNTFWNLVKLGKEVREIHLLESNKVEDYITSYEMAVNAENDHNVITTKIVKKDWEIIDTEKQLGRIWINESKYFDNVPVTAWEFFIGGYQPAQKWLKDRKERELNYEDILHYQKIIVALTETDRIMKEIDKIEID